MQNAVLVKYEGKVLTVLLVHEVEFLSLDRVLDQYAEFGGFYRDRLSGHWVDVIDITKVKGHRATQPTAAGPWPEINVPDESATKGRGDSEHTGDTKCKS